MDTPLGSRYVLHDLLGRGAMGQVFRGSVRGSGTPVAVKVLKPELVSDTEVVARFFRERSILTSIDHPNVAKVLDLVVEGETLGIVMELVDGQDLRRYLRARGTLPPARGGVPDQPTAAGPDGRPRRGHRAPRREAGERAGQHDPRPDDPQAHRLRRLPALLWCLADEDDQPDRHPRVHGAGTRRP